MIKKRKWIYIIYKENFMAFVLNKMYLIVKIMKNFFNAPSVKMDIF